MKRFLMVLLFAVLPLAKAQTLEFSISYPLTAGLAVSDIALSDVFSVGFAASLERLKVSGGAVLDIAPIGTAQASASLEWAFVGRFRGQFATKATLGSATLNLGATFWNAAPAHFDAFEIFAIDPLPNSVSGSRIDFGLGLRISRNWSLFGQFKFGSDASSNTLALRYRTSGLELTGGVKTIAQTNGAVYLAQTSLALTPEDSALAFSVGAGVGLLNNAFTFETNLGFSWVLSEAFELELIAVYQPYRFEVLPLRSQLELRVAPGFGKLALTGFAGLNQANSINWGVRLSYRITLEELFPSPESRVSSAFRLP